MSGLKEELRKQRLFETNITIEQQREDYYLNRSFYLDRVMQEAERLAYEEKAHEQEIKEAEKMAGLEQKTIPAEEIPAEALQQMQSEYASINKGKKLSGKAKSKVEKEYQRKMRQSESAGKILDSFETVEKGMASFIEEQTKTVTGQDNLNGLVRKNKSVVALSTIMNGQTMVNATYAMRSLSVNTDKATEEECERKAMESERIFKVIMDYDLSKLKYNNSDEFLKNLGEKLTITTLGSEADYLLSDYRKLKKEGKIKNPLPDRFINEIEARINTLTTINTRVVKKSVIMKSPMYGVLSEDSINALKTEEVVLRMMQYSNRANDPEATEEERQKAAQYRDYYEAVMSLRNLDSLEKETEKFGRGTDPLKLLELNRKEADASNPPSDNEEEPDYESYKNASMKEQYNALLDSHLLNKKIAQGNLSFMGQSKDAVDYANLTNAENMRFLKENPILRRREIRRYYAKMHGGSDIPAELLRKIENNFEEKFAEAEKLSDSVKLIDSYNTKQANRIKSFENDNRDENGALKYSYDRGANTYLALLDNLSNEKKLLCYESYKKVIELNSDSLNKNGQKNYTAIFMELPEAELKKERDSINEGMKPLFDFALNFDLKKLEFTKISDLLSRYNEVAPLLNMLEEMQKFPNSLLRLGTMEEKEWVEITARIAMGTDLSMMIKNMMALHTSSVFSLVDDDEMHNVIEASKVDITDQDEIEARGFTFDYVNNAFKYTQTESESDSLPELNQLYKYNENLRSEYDIAYFKPGESMENAMKKYRTDAKKQWDNAHR